VPQRHLVSRTDAGFRRGTAASGDGQTEALFDALGLEVQRSMDCYDRIFLQVSITQLLVVPG